MPRKKYLVVLDDAQRQELHQLLAAGQARARKLTHARILLKADASPQGPAWPDAQIAQALEIDPRTVERVRRRFAEQGGQAALERKRPSRIYKKAIDGRAEAVLVATACSEPPPGHSHWTLRLLAGRLVELGLCDSVSHESVRQVMKKKRAQAVAGRAVGHPSGPKRGLRGRHGGGA